MDSSQNKTEDMGFYEELKKRRSEVMAELEAIDVLLKGSNPGPTPNVVQKENAPIPSDLTKELKDATIPQKFLIVLKENQRFMKIREIAQFIKNVVGGNEDEWTMRLSRTTGKLKEMDKIKGYKVGNSNSNVFWGSPKWLDNEGEIKEKYKYKIEVIEKSNTLLDL